MTDEELTKLRQAADTDDPAALFAYARALKDIDKAESDKYVILAAQLGHARAAEIAGDIYLAQGNYDAAMTCFRNGARAGVLDCSVKLAAMRLANNEPDALAQLEDLAEIGLRSACVALAEYYKAKGNRKQYAYWHSLIK